VAQPLTNASLAILQHVLHALDLLGTNANHANQVLLYFLELQNAGGIVALNSFG
jgi:hypothetical protein